jgi:hypothetical protein
MKRNAIFGPPHKNGLSLQFTLLIPIRIRRNVTKVTGKTSLPWLRKLGAGLPPRRSRLDTKLVHLRFVMDKVAVEHAFLQILRFTPASIIPLLIYIYRCYTNLATDSHLKTQTKITRIICVPWLHFPFGVSCLTTF